MGKLGITNQDNIVVYDSAGLFSSPRAWWTFKVFGHERVWVLNGGLKKWLQENRAVTDQVPAIAVSLRDSGIDVFGAEIKCRHGC
jgi:thiosulfate/3-mercaptopyruvate sulfurtransferase